VVTIKGRGIYLGKWNTAASGAEHDRLIAEFLANGRQLRDGADTTVVEVIDAYRKYAEGHYRKHGELTREFGCIREALRIVRELYGRTVANDFGPLALKAVRQRMLENGWSRGLHQQIDRTHPAVFPVGGGKRAGPARHVSRADGRIRLTQRSLRGP
jgi:hypothetical protein